ncbi:hypothetical protein MKZ38_003772 [Zalerion maritima]|uniref:Bacteriophage T5 Orf172 DNA-binding domain-containing protein n=1 Tax=Zalerion maritima TaxID=339359 RepID=A0AAD5RTV3_9PEZI|nr:hypothetical protein MKZ38_003772 [Zalerion maritima]
MNSRETSNDTDNTRDVSNWQIARWRDQRENEALVRQIERPFTAMEYKKPGFVYVYKLLGNKHYFKIGFTSKVALFKKKFGLESGVAETEKGDDGCFEKETKCNKNVCRLVHWSAEAFVGARKAEQLVQAELEAKRVHVEGAKLRVHGEA